MCLIAREGIEINQHFVADNYWFVMQRHSARTVVTSRRPLRNDGTGVIHPFPLRAFMPSSEHHREQSSWLVHSTRKSEVQVSIVERNHALDGRRMDAFRIDVLRSFRFRPLD